MLAKCYAQLFGLFTVQLHKAQAVKLRLGVGLSNICEPQHFSFAIYTQKINEGLNHSARHGRDLHSEFSNYEFGYFIIALQRK